MARLSKPQAHRTRQARIEALETREMPSAATTAVLAWFDTTIQSAEIRSLGKQDYQQHGRLSRTDMMGILRQAEDNNVVTSVEFTDLTAIVQNSTLFVGVQYVQALASNIVLGNAANAYYQGDELGNLTAWVSADHLEKLVGKWFLGTDHPTAYAYGYEFDYEVAAGRLFAHKAVFTDVRQGGVGDCYFLSSLAVTVVRTPNVIQSMFIVNGDGTYTVRFYHNGQPTYVTVDSQLPTTYTGQFIFANSGQYASNKGTTLWVALAEKAYAQLNEQGWLRAVDSGGGRNAYQAISGGYIYEALAQITGRTNATYQRTTRPTDFSAFAKAYNSGALVGFSSYSTPLSRLVVGGHAYAVIGFKQSTRQVTLYNPWGNNNGSSYPGTLILTWNQVQANFGFWQRALCGPQLLAMASLESPPKMFELSV